MYLDEHEKEDPKVFSLSLLYPFIIIIWDFILGVEK
jgi:hypothetical protein